MARDYGFLMIGYEKPEMIQELQNMIPYEELYVEEDSDDYGMEDEPHVTLVPCLDKHLDVETLKHELESLEKYQIVLTNISKFDNENFDVLKCDVGSVPLVDTNCRICDKFPTYTEFRDYHPHMTIAYLKKGMADKYLKNVIAPLVVLKPTCFIWTGCDGEGNDLNLKWE